MSLKVPGSPLGMVVAFWLGSVLAAPVVHGQTKPVDLDVPYVPTRPEAVQAMLKLAKVTQADYVFDLGCGDGRIVIAAAKDYKARGLGVDLDPQRVRESNDNATKAGVTDLVKFRVEDIMVTDVREASVVALFLLDSVNLQVRPRLLAQLKPGSRVVSNSFHMADWKPDESLRHEAAYSGVIHLWIVPAPVGGTWRWKTTMGEGPGRTEVSDSLELRQQFQVITGAVHPSGSGEAPIAKASLSGKQIRFSATRRAGDQEVEVAYEGTVEGDAIQGTQKWAGGPSAGTYPWTATRDRLDIAGRWQISAPENANSAGTLQISRKDGALLATYVRDSKPQEQLSVPAFYVWGSSIRFEIPSQPDPLVFRGSLTADAGGGTVAAGLESEQETKWTAKRLAAK